MYERQGANYAMKRFKEVELGKGVTAAALNNHIKNKHPAINLASVDDANLKILLNPIQQTLITCLEKKKNYGTLIIQNL